MHLQFAKSPTLDTLLKMSDIYNCEIAELLPSPRTAQKETIPALAEGKAKADTRRGEKTSCKEEAIRETVCLILRRAGLNGTRREFDHLTKAVMLVLEDPSYLRHVTARLYAEVALELGVTSLQVERSMRTAIEKIWNRDNMHEIE